MSSGLIPRGNQNQNQSTSGAISCISVTASSFVSTPNLIATNITTSNLGIDNLTIKELTFKPSSSGTILNNSASVNATLVLPTVSGTLVNNVISAPGVTVPIYSSIPSVNGKAVINGLVSGSSDFINLTTAPPSTGGNIVLSAGFKTVLTDNVVTLTNKTLTSPIISSISNTGVLTLPTATGVVALVSQIPTNYVDLVSSQTIGGVKTFSTSPVIDSITTSSAGIITVPQGISSKFALQSIAACSANNLVEYFLGSPNPVVRDSGVSTASVCTLSGTQTLSNKTLTSPVISSISNTGVLTLPTTTGTVALVSQIPTNLNYVDLVSSQTIGGVKTFSTSPVIDSITTSSAGIITVPQGISSKFALQSVAACSPNNLVEYFLGSPNPVVRDSGMTTASVCTLSGAQTLTNKTLTSPVISSISNTGVLTLPTTTGVVALVSQIPTNLNYVDLASNQTIGGIKTFSVAPVISSISNTGVLTLPISTDTLIGRVTTDTLVNKTLTLPSIASINNGGTVVIPAGAGTFCTLAAAQVLTNKTLTAPQISKIIGAGAAPTVIAGVALGTGPTALIAGFETGGLLTFTTGTLPTSGVLGTITIAAFGNNNYCPSIMQANSAAALMGPVFVSILSTSQWTVNCTTALVAATTYLFRFQVQG